MNIQSVEFKLEKKSVNSKVLCEEIQKDVADLITNAGVMWSSDTHRESFVETIDDLMKTLHEEGKLDQWNVMCDLRNNSISQMDLGIYIFEVNFKQKNCLNKTRLVYTIKDLLIASLKDLLNITNSP